MNWTLPPQLNEAGNGVLLIMFFFAAIFFTFYIIRAWRETGGNGSIKWQLFRTDENKTAIAFLTVSVGMTIKVATEWWWFHLVNHGLKFQYPILVPAFIIGTLTSAWGLLCLLRVLTRYDWSPWTWTWMTIAALMFGIGFAL